MRKGLAISIRSAVLPKERSLLGNLIAVLPKGDTPGFGLAKLFVGVDIDEDGGPGAAAFGRGGLFQGEWDDPGFGAADFEANGHFRVAAPVDVVTHAMHSSRIFAEFQLVKVAIDKGDTGGMAAMFIEIMRQHLDKPGLSAEEAAAKPTEGDEANE